MFYHSALKNKAITYTDIKETNRIEHHNGIMLKHDVVSDGLAPEFDECDFLYSEPPYAPSGLKVFNERAGVNDRTFKDLLEAISRIVASWTKPIYLIMSETNLKKLPNPDVIAQTSLNGDLVSLGVWNESNPILQSSTQLICSALGQRYSCMGDFTCGYGYPIKSFIKGGGKRFVASDYDGKCITVISSQMRKL
ncbi:MAG: hypothetical protein CMF11_01940 [Idiomarina sp.]|nr:hypothetical protein [Idiomarina sp.]